MQTSVLLFCNKQPNSYSETLSHFLEDNLEYCIGLIRKKPQILKYFQTKETFIRILWKKYFTTDDDYKPFIELIRYNLIPDEQLDEAFEHILNTLHSSIFDKESWWYTADQLINELDKMVLNERGFFKAFYKMAFRNSKIMYDVEWARQNIDLVIYYLKYFGLDECIVNAINNSLSNYSVVWKDKLRTFYKENQSILGKHIEISKKLPKDVPEILSEVFS